MREAPTERSERQRASRGRRGPRTPDIFLVRGDKQAVQRPSTGRTTCIRRHRRSCVFTPEGPREGPRTATLPSITTRRRSPGEGSIYEDATKPGRWIGRAIISGQRRKVVRSTKTEAQKALMALMAQGERGTVGNGNITVKAAVEAYTVRRLAGRDLAPSTRVREEWAMAYIVAKLGGRRLRGLTVAHIETALDQLAAAGLARESLVNSPTRANNVSSRPSAVTVPIRSG